MTKKTLTLIYIVSSILIVGLAFLRLFHILNSTSYILIVVVLVSYVQSKYINTLEEKLKDTEKNK